MTTVDPNALCGSKLSILTTYETLSFYRWTSKQMRTDTDRYSDTLIMIDEHGKTNYAVINFDTWSNRGQKN